MLEESNIQPIEQSTIEVTHQPQEQLTKRDYDFVALRKKAEEAERRAYEAEQQLQRQNQSQVVVEEEDFNVDNEDYVQAKHVKTSTKKIHKELSATKQELNDLKEKIAYLSAKVDTDSLKDFREVVNDENIAKLREMYPDDHYALTNIQDLRLKSKMAYNMIKNYKGILSQQSSETFHDLRAADERLASNKQKPQSASLAAPKTSSSPLTRITDDGRMILNEDDKKRVWQNWQDRKARSGW